MDLKLQPLSRDELSYGYTPSHHIGMITGHIGHLRVDFDTSGKGFFTSWDDNLLEFKTEEFQKNFGEVVDALRKDTRFGLMFKDLENMKKWGYGHPEMKIDEYYYGMRVDSEQYSYICRLDPRKGVYNGYIYCYHKETLDDYLKNCQRGIRYTEQNPYKRVTLAHGATLDIQDKTGKTMSVNCKYYGEGYMIVTQGLHEEVVKVDQYFQGLRDKGMTYTRETGIYTEQNLNERPGTYAIYQLPEGERYHNYRFTGLDTLEKMKLKPLMREDYNLVYMGTSIKNDKEKLLNHLYETFNVNHPLDFSGHSLSVSDVIATNLDGEISYHYVDRMGFQKIPFTTPLLPEQENPITQLVGLAKTDLEGFVDALSSYENRAAVETALTISQLKSQLETPVSFQDLVELNSFCHDTWLKTEGLEFVRVQDFVAEAINENIVTIDQLVAVPYREFGIMVLDGDVADLKQCSPEALPVKQGEEKLSMLEKLLAKPEPGQSAPHKPKGMER